MGVGNAIESWISVLGSAYATGPGRALAFVLFGSIVFSVRTRLLSHNNGSKKSRGAASGPSKMFILIWTALVAWVSAIHPYKLPSSSSHPGVTPRVAETTELVPKRSKSPEEENDDLARTDLGVSLADYANAGEEKIPRQKIYSRTLLKQAPF